MLHTIRAAGFYCHDAEATSVDDIAKSIDDIARSTDDIAMSVDASPLAKRKNKRSAGKSMLLSFLSDFVHYGERE